MKIQKHSIKNTLSAKVFGNNHSNSHTKCHESMLNDIVKSFVLFLKSFLRQDFAFMYSVAFFTT